MKTDFKAQQIHSLEQRVVLSTLAGSVAKPGCQFLEVGSWCGDSSVLLAKIAQQHGGQLICVDWWRGNAGTNLINIAERENVFDFFWENIKKESLQDTVVPIRSRSDLASEYLKKGKFDLVFLDADHRYTSIIKDIEGFSPTVNQQGGILCGHDCEGRVSDYTKQFLLTGKRIDYHEGVHCGVVLAVGQSFNNYSIDHSIWSVRANKHHPKWRPTNLSYPNIEPARQNSPSVIGESQHFLFKRYGKVVYGIPLALSNIDVTAKEEINDIFQTNNLSRAAALAGEIIYQPPNNIGTLGEYRLVEFDGLVYGLRKTLGHIDLIRISEDDLRKHQSESDCVIGKSVDEVTTVIETLRAKRLQDELDYAELQLELTSKSLETMSNQYIETKLELELELKNNQITKLELKNNQITELELKNNQITKLELKNNQITELELKNNQITQGLELKNKELEHSRTQIASLIRGPLDKSNQLGLQRNQERISIIIPTRERPERLTQLLESLKQTTSIISRLEVILVVDKDDDSYDNLICPDINIKWITATPGSPMGALNMLGYGACTGEYVMLLNDDVVVMTENWDDRVLETLRCFPDGIILIHVNDGLFHESLCTFPLVSRTFCSLVGGICPKEFIRYRIDDHIYNIFNLLSVLGHNRIVYLSDVLFKHLNFRFNPDGIKQYVPDANIHAKDSVRFEELLPTRKTLVTALARCIKYFRENDIELIHYDNLSDVDDSIALRKPEFIRHSHSEHSLSSQTVRTTIGVATADRNSTHAEQCLGAIKENTENYELVLLDNNRCSRFNHPSEMNRLILTCKTDFLVIMDDDVFVRPGWLDGMLESMKPDVGLVVPLHTNTKNEISFAGIVMSPDKSGHHSHAFKVHPHPFPIQTVCSAIMLIDINKCGHIHFSESYLKYFFDLVFGLRVWESGYKVVLAPSVSVTHVGGATLPQGSELSTTLFEKDRLKFQREWMETERYHKLEQSQAWNTQPEINQIISMPNRALSLIDLYPQETESEYFARCKSVLEELKLYPSLEQAVHRQLLEQLEDNYWAVGPSPEDRRAYIRGFIGQPITIKTALPHASVVFVYGQFYLRPIDGPEFRLASIETNQTSAWAISDDLQAIVNLGSGETPLSVQISEENFLGFNIIHCGLYYGILQGDGVFDMARVVRNDYAYLYTGHRLDEVRGQISSLSPIRRTIAKLKLKIKRNQNTQPKLAAQAETRKLVVQSGRNLQAKTTKSRINDSDLDNGLCRYSASPEQNLILNRVVDSYRGYSLWKYGQMYLAIQHGETVDKSALENHEFIPKFIAHDIAELKLSIDSKVSSAIGNSKTTIVLAWQEHESIREVVSAEFPDNRIVYVVANNKTTSKDIQSVDHASLFDWANDIIDGKKTIPDWGEKTIEAVVIPWNGDEIWQNNRLETVAEMIADCVVLVTNNGSSLSFSGERLHRLVYNKAYLSQMFSLVPAPAGLRVLEIGCGDGLVCDLISVLEPTEIVGIDSTPSVHISPRKNTKYINMNAENLTFKDNSFDLIYSIATMEHITNPYQSISELIRVLKPGGYAYIQAGPLYHSPFGHHMFGYFDAHPWIHLRKDMAGIIAQAKNNRMEELLQDRFNISIKDYVAGMMTKEHVNGLFLNEYRLSEATNNHNIQLLDYQESFEGEELLTDEIRRELSDYTVEQLTEHGFHLAFRKQLTR